MDWVKKVEGFPLPDFAEKNYYLIRDLQLRHGDVIISTFPKSGTHWLVYIIWRIMHPEDQNPEGKRVMKSIPFADRDGLHAYATSPENVGRTFLTHLPSDRLPNRACAKYVVMVRNPLDCCVSFYHFCKDTVGLGLAESTEEEGSCVSKLYFDYFMDGEMMYGCYFDHVKKWYNRRNEPNVHFMIYEQLKANPKEEILKLATFLGHEDMLLDNDGMVLDQIVEESSFDSMKKNLRYTNANCEAQDLPIFRKGQIGSYKTSLSNDQVRKLQGKMAAELEGTTLLDLWRHL